ncbi:hypothetical protein BH23GEM4_BH23GEM4_19360 [soil metagenome]
MFCITELRLISQPWYHDSPDMGSFHTARSGKELG